MQPLPSIATLFKQNCEQFKHRTALICEQDKLTYGALLERIQDWSQIIAHLSAQTAQKPRLCIALDKGIPYVEVIYTALLTGGTYVPVDTLQPIERIHLIIEQAKPDVVITTKARKEKLLALLNNNTQNSNLPVFITLEDRDTLLAQTTGNTSKDKSEIPPFVNPDGADIAAILFTSGSTGTPKGVQLSHQNLACFIHWAIQALAINQDDCLSNHASFSFDLSTFDLFAAATTGACTWIITQQQQRDVNALSEGIQHHKVSIWYSVPSVLSMLVAATAITQQTTATLRHVIFAGEPFPLTGLARLKHCLPNDCSLYNWYGPTETNVCFSHRVTAQDFQRPTLPIGLPLPGLIATLAATDASEKQTDKACNSGELIVSGPCVTPGYVNVRKPRIDTMHQQEKHPTGDWVRFDQGLYFYQGRLDDCVKIHGNRVELGEITACINLIENVRNNCVIYTAQEETPRLIAFLELKKQAEAPNILALKQHVSKQLPKYMIPHSLRVLPALPLNANGKVDRQHLMQLAKRELTQACNRQGAMS